MLKMEIDKFGNFEGYTPKTRVVTPYEPAHEEGKAIVKMYSMFPKKIERNIDSLMGFTKDYIKEELRFNRIGPKIGLGFAIVSEDTLNVNMWGGDYPSLINPNIYIFNNSEPPMRDWDRVDIRSAGAYCAWEGEIVGHESKAWREYMLSGRTKGDKILYLENVYSGIIKDVPAGLAGTDLSRLEIMPRTLTGLNARGIITVRDLLSKTEQELLGFRNISNKGVESIKRTLSYFDLKLKEK